MTTTTMTTAAMVRTEALALLATLAAGCFNVQSTASNTASASGSNGSSAEGGGTGSSDDGRSGRADAECPAESSELVRGAGYVRREHGERVVRAGFLRAAIRGVRRGRNIPLCPGGRLRSGDAFYVDARTGEDAYLYVFMVAADRSAVLLYPPDDVEELLVRRGATQQIPPGDDEEFRLDTDTGVENFFVIATRQPLRAAGGDLAAVVDEVRRTGTIPAAEAAPEAAPESPASTGDGATMVAAAGPTPDSRASPAGHSASGGHAAGRDRRAAPRFSHAMRVRGAAYVRRSERAVYASPDDDGVAVVRFPVEHVD